MLFKFLFVHTYIVDDEELAFAVAARRLMGNGNPYVEEPSLAERVFASGADWQESLNAAFGPGDLKEKGKWEKTRRRRRKGEEHRQQRRRRRRRR